jgi:hypothetical protein
VIARPPLNGAPNDTCTCPFPATTPGLAGAEGTALGTTAGDAGDAGPGPFAFRAKTWHVYDFPFERPTTSTGEATPAANPGTPPSEETHDTPNPVIALPPSNGARNDTVTRPLPAATAGWAGASGAPLGVTAADAADGRLGPSTLFAVTVHVYDFPFDTEPTTSGELGPEASPATPPSDEPHDAP